MRSSNGKGSSLIRNRSRFDSLSHYVIINPGYTPAAPRVKRVIETTTRTFDDNENLIEERHETDTEYEYNQGYITYNSPNTNTYSMSIKPC